MKSLSAACLAVITLAASAWAQTPPTPVTVTPKTMEFTFERSSLGEGARGSSVPGSGYYPIRDPATKKPVFVKQKEATEVVILDNGLVEAWVCPSLGGRLLRAIDKKTGTDYFWRRMKDGEWVFDDMLAWNPGGVKASFPFFEHGLGLRINSGWQSVVAADGSATIAMDMRFTDQVKPGDIDRYGRYGDEVLTTMVTLRPGSTVIEWKQRKDNNNATPRSDRMWNDTSFPMPTLGKTVTEKNKAGETVTRQVADTDAIDRVFEFLFPARWVVDHGPSQVHTSPHWSALKNWNVSHFAVDAPYGFAGGYYAEGDLNRLRINHTHRGFGPGCKLWTAPGADMFEVWGGEGWVFEYPGELQPAYKPTSFVHHYWLAKGIGKVAYANASVAAGVEGTTFAIVASREAQAVVSDDTGNELAKAAVGPYTPIKGTFSGKRLIVKLDGLAVMDQTFPLNRPVPAKETPIEPAAQAKLDMLKAGNNPSHPLFFERGCYGRNQGQPGLVNAMGEFAKLTQSQDAPRTASLARVAYRLGNLEQAERLAKLAGGAEGDFVLGLLAMEKGEASDFGKAGWEADYLRSLVARKGGNTAKAIALAESYIKNVPDAWYPRLAVARWKNDAAAAGALAAENPASPEAQLVLKLLGKPNNLAKTIGNRPEAEKHVAAFEGQIERGEYRPVPRYPLELIQKKGW